MATRVTEIREETQDAGEHVQPISFSFSAPDDREVKMVVGRRGVVLENGSHAAPPTRTTVYETAAQPSVSELLTLGTWAQSFQSAQQQQLALLHDLSERVSHLEESVGARSTGTPTERATWWALWGLLMLILGGALAILILLILTENNSFIIVRR